MPPKVTTVTPALDEIRCIPIVFCMRKCDQDRTVHVNDPVLRIRWQRRDIILANIVTPKHDSQNRHGEGIKYTSKDLTFDNASRGRNEGISGLAEEKGRCDGSLHGSVGIVY